MWQFYKKICNLFIYFQIGLRILRSLEKHEENHIKRVFISNFKFSPKSSSDVFNSKSYRFLRFGQQIDVFKQYKETAKFWKLQKRFFINTFLFVYSTDYCPSFVFCFWSFCRNIQKNPKVFSLLLNIYEKFNPYVFEFLNEAANQHQTS